MAPIARGDKRAFFDVNINGEPAGRIVFALWNFSCPSTVENFRALCTGELGELYGHPATYQGSIFHRVVKGFMIQGGDITHKNGQGGFSIYGRQFDDENLSLKHNKPYLLSMANRGPDTNGSQFFITTQETPHLDGKHVVFGEVVKGIELVKRIENLEVDEEDKPLDKVQVVYSGEMVKKGGAVDKMKDQMEETKEKEPSGVKMDDEPKTNNWLMRRSRSPEDRKKRDSEDRRHRRRDNQRREKRRFRSRSRRSRSPREHERRDRKRPTITTKDGVKIKGRGKVTFLGNRNRSATPPHWRREESKKHTLEEHRKRQEELEERDKRRAQRDKEYEERRALREKEQKEKKARRELDRQKREAEEELERQNDAAEDTVKEESESSKDSSESSGSSDSDSSDSD